MIKRVNEPPSDPPLEHLGSTSVNQHIGVNLHRTRSGFRLVYDDTGIFEVSADGARLLWFPGPRAHEDAVRGDLLGRVLSLAIHAQGQLVLHGSAVAIDGGAVAFVGDKHSGKSTLAMSMVSSGARLLTDDSLPVDLGPPVQACPGVHGVWLWEDALAQLYARDSAVIGEVVKHLVSDLPGGSVEHEEQPLLAVYVLVPELPSEALPPARREQLPRVPATLALVRQAKLGPLLGKSETPKLLERAAAAARHVPVYALRFSDGFDALPAVVERVIEWSLADAR